MNLEKMEKLAQKLESLDPANFNIGFWGDEFKPIVCEEDMHECGTTCCIAGWQIIEMGLCLTPAGEVFKNKNDHNTWRISPFADHLVLGQAEYIAGKELDLTYHQQSKLFLSSSWPESFFKSYRDITPQDAAKRIRYMMETGE